MKSIDEKNNRGDSEKKVSIELLRALWVAARYGNFNMALERFPQFSASDLAEGFKALIEEYRRLHFPEPDEAVRKTQSPEPPIKYKQLDVYSDGGSRGNPGASAGAAILKTAEGKVIDAASKYLGEATNNIAEYEGLILALELAAKYKPERIRIFTDSELVACQMKGEWRVKDPNIRELHTRAQELLALFPEHEINYIPREKNTDADRLVNDCLDKETVNQS
ncbi:MAG: hypothetical protein Kow0090_01700 [Myxococcota bacterium]